MKPFDPPEILLVDDNDDDVVLLQEAFADAQLLNALAVARDGEEALAYLRCEGRFSAVRQPALVLLDINMPRMNGFEVLEAMRDDPRLQSIRVVMLTTSRRDEDVAKSFAEGACSFLSKPVSIEALEQVAGAILRRQMEDT